MTAEHRELRQARRQFVSALWPSRSSDQRFLWRRCSLLCGAGDPTPSAPTPPGVKYQPFFEEIAKATADRAGDTVRVTAFVYAIKTYLPAVPSGPHFYDFVIGRPVSYIDADDAARILREELDWLFASRWTEYHAVARSLVPCTPEHVAVQDLGGVWWRVAAEPSFEVFLDGNRRFAVADRGQSEPVRTRGVSVDLADALQTLRWR